MEKGLCPHPVTAHHYDRPRGIVTCMQCGDVVNEEAFELDPTFARGEKLQTAPRTAAPGFARPQRSAQLTATGLSRPSVEAARRALGAIARQLDIPADHVEIAAGVYKMAVNTNCVVGARSPVLCACLYIVCRRKATPHMVLDFADVTGDSPFWIMKYLRLISAVTGTTVPPVDASCYLIRLAQQLQLGDMLNPVSVFALKILRTMKDDWIHTGRRPLGPCGAALIVACRAYGIPRTVADVSDLVRLGEGTITLRLQEFLATDAAKLTDVDEYAPSEKSSPVAFLRGRQRDDDYAYTSAAITLSAMYWELVSDAREGKEVTPERIEKWNEFWNQRDLLQNYNPNSPKVVGESPAEKRPPPSIPDLANLSPTQQLECLGLPKEVVVTPKTEEEFTQEMQQLAETEALAKLESAGSNGKVEGATVSGLLGGLEDQPQPQQKAELSMDDANRVVGGSQQQQRSATMNLGSDVPKQRDRLEVIVLPPEEEDNDDDAVVEYIITDLEQRIQREKVAERTYGVELWSRGAAKETPNYEPEDPRFGETKVGRKRPRKEVVESATAAEAVAAGLRHRGAGQIAIEGLAQLLPEGKHGAGVSSVGGGSELGSLDDEWPID